MSTMCNNNSNNTHNIIVCTTVIHCYIVLRP